MGLLPIFLTLTLFVFLWGLVNYNAFAAKRAYIRQLGEEADRLNGSLREITGRLLALLSPANRTTTPGYPQPTNDARYVAAQGPELAEAWHRFAAADASLRGNEEAGTLLNQLEETASGQYQVYTRLERAIDDYNRHCRKMPYRLVALLFGFRPILQKA
jgi:hypothetical protein